MMCEREVTGCSEAAVPVTDLRQGFSPPRCLSSLPSAGTFFSELF